MLEKGLGAVIVLQASCAVWLTTEVLKRCAIVCYATQERILIAKRSTYMYMYMLWRAVKTRHEP